MTDGRLELTGSASIPSWYGIAWASYSWASLLADHRGVRVRFNSEVLSILFGFGAPKVDDRIGWSADWNTLRTVEVAPRSVRFVPREGRTCRFVSMTRKKTRRIEEILEHYEIPIRKVPTTLLIARPMVTRLGRS